MHKHPLKEMCNCAAIFLVNSFSCMYIKNNVKIERSFTKVHFFFTVYITADRCVDIRQY